MEQQAKAPQDLRNVVKFLRSSNAGLKIRVGIYNDKRIDYFKGKSAVKALLSPAYAKLKNVPKVTSETEAQQVLHSIIPFAFFLRVDRNAPTAPGAPSPAPSSSSSSHPKRLVVNQMQLFNPDEYYAWFYEGSQLMMYAGGFAMVVVMLAGVMFPLWPPVVRLGASYLSFGVLGLIGLFFAIALVRLIFYVITLIVASPGIWIFPKLFADVGFVESFIPLWEWDIPKKKGKKKKTESSSDGKKSKKSAPTSGTATPDNGNAADPADSRPQSRSARIEEVADDED